MRRQSRSRRKEAGRLLQMTPPLLSSRCFAPSPQPSPKGRRRKSRGREESRKVVLIRHEVLRQVVPFFIIVFVGLGIEFGRVGDHFKGCVFEIDGVGQNT